MAFVYAKVTPEFVVDIGILDVFICHFSISQEKYTNCFYEWSRHQIQGKRV